jgi:hypothetical protein
LYWKNRLKNEIPYIVVANKGDLMPNNEYSIDWVGQRFYKKTKIYWNDNITLKSQPFLQKN